LLSFSVSTLVLVRSILYIKKRIIGKVSIVWADFRVKAAEIVC